MDQAMARGGVDDTTDSPRAVACIRFVRFGVGSAFLESVDYGSSNLVHRTLRNVRRSCGKLNRKTFSINRESHGLIVFI